MYTGLKLPVTGGLFSTDGLIVIGVAVVFIIIYVLFCVLREDKNNDMKEFDKEDFVDDKQKRKQ